MNKLEYPEVSLYKLRLLSKGEESLIATRRDEKQHFYNVSLDTIGNYYSLEEAEAALKTHKETDNEVIVYQIIGPEHGHGNSTFVESEIDGIPDEIFETEDYDESPEFQIVFNANREFISSYFYDANNPGGARLENENTFNVGDMVWMSGSCFLNEENLNILVPVIIESVAQNKCRLNIESDGVRAKPLVTVKSNWGEYPASAERLIPRIDLLPLNIIKE